MLAGGRKDNRKARAYSPNARTHSRSLEKLAAKFPVEIRLAAAGTTAQRATSANKAFSQRSAERNAASGCRASRDRVAPEAARRLPWRAGGGDGGNAAGPAPLGAARRNTGLNSSGRIIVFMAQFSFNESRTRPTRGLFQESFGRRNGARIRRPESCSPRRPSLQRDARGRASPHKRTRPRRSTRVHRRRG